MLLNYSANCLSEQKTRIDTRHVSCSSGGIKNIRKKGIDKWYWAEYNLLVLLIPLKEYVVLSGNILRLSC